MQWGEMQTGVRRGGGGEWACLHTLLPLPKPLPRRRPPGVQAIEERTNALPNNVLFQQCPRRAGDRGAVRGAGRLTPNGAAA
jgi:hypothetical protein